MKNIHAKLITLVALVMPVFVPGAVRARSLPEVVNVVTITATATVQNENVVDNGTNTVTPAPLVRSVKTKDVLKQLALDKFAQGDYETTNFPSGAKLVVFGEPGSFTFQVWGRTNNFLVDVSDIIRLEEYGRRNVFSGRVNNDTSLANHTITDRRIMGLSFDDTFIPDGGNIQFYMVGIVKSVITDTTPNSTTGRYTETQLHSASAAAGEGSYHDSSLVISGSFSAGGKATLESF